MRGKGLLLVRLVVLGDDVRGDPSPVADLQALLPGPVPDRAQLLRASVRLLPLTGWPLPRLYPIGPPRVLHVRGERLVQRRGMLLIEVDFVVPAGVAKPHRLHRWRPVQVVKTLGDQPLHHWSLTPPRVQRTATIALTIA